MARFTRYDLQITQEPDDYADIVEKVMEDIEAGYHDDELLSILEKRRYPYDDLINDIYGYGEEFVKAILGSTPEAEKLRKKLQGVDEDTFYEELIDVLRHRDNPFQALVDDMFAYDPQLAREIIWGSMEGKRLEDELIDEAIRQANEPPEPPMPWD